MNVQIAASHAVMDSQCFMNAFSGVKVAALASPPETASPYFGNAFSHYKDKHVHFYKTS